MDEGLRVGGEADLSQLARVDVGQVAAVFEVDDEAGVGGRGLVGTEGARLAGHAEMEGQPGAVVQAGEEVFAVPMGGFEPVTDQVFP